MQHTNKHKKTLKLLLSISSISIVQANLIGGLATNPSAALNSMNPNSPEINANTKDEGDNSESDSNNQNNQQNGKNYQKQPAKNKLSNEELLALQAKSGHDTQNAELANSEVSVYGASLQESKDMKLHDTTTLGKLTDSELQVVFNTNVIMGGVDLTRTSMNIQYPEQKEGYADILAGTITKEDQEHSLSFGRPVVALGAQVTGKNYSINVVIENMATGFDKSDGKTDTNLIGSGRKISELYFQQAGVKLGSKKSAQLDIGVVKSVAMQVTPSDKLFYRGSDRGVFGDAFKYFTWVTLSDSAIDKFNYSHPKNQFFGIRDLAGDLITAPKLNLWTPLFESEDGKISFRAGVGVSTTTDAQDGIIGSLGGYVDFNISKEKNDKRFVRFSFGGIASGKEENQVYHTPKGGRLTLSYHSKPFDVGMMGIYNDESYVRKASFQDVKYLTGDVTTLTNPDALNQMTVTNSEDSSVTQYTYNENKATGNMGMALQGRIGLSNDIDLTVGGVYTTRNTGWESEGTEHNEEFWGASIGINGPLFDLPFRIGADLSYLTTKNGAITPETAASQSVGSEKTPKNDARGTDGEMILLSIGVRYNPAD